MDIEDYKLHLGKCGFSQRTVESYLWVAEFFADKYGEPSPASLSSYKERLERSYKPNTVNQRIQRSTTTLAIWARVTFGWSRYPWRKARQTPRLTTPPIAGSYASCMARDIGATTMPYA